MDHSYSTHVLPCGLKVLFVPMKGIGHVHIQIYVGFGSQSETTKETLEMAHMVEHMQSKYTSKKHPKSKPIAKWMADTGCRGNASTHLPYTLYYTTCLKQYFHQVLDVQLRSMTDFVMDMTVFDAERNSVIEEIQTKWLNWTWIKLHEKTQKKLSQVPCLRSEASERVRLVKKMKAEDVLRFRNRHYDPSKMMIVVAGDFDCGRAEREIGRFFRNSPSHDTTDTIDYRKVFDTTFHGPEVLYVPNHKVQNTRIKLTWVLPASITPSDVHTSVMLDLIQDMLTSGMDSRLLRLLRTEKKIVYFVGMSVSLDYNGNGTVIIYTETNPIHVPMVVEIIHSEVRSLKTKPISTTELHRVRNRCMLDEVEEPTYKSPSKYADRYAEYFFYDKPVVREKDRLELIRRATKKDILDTAQLVFKDDKLLVGYSGPKEYNIRIAK